MCLSGYGPALPNTSSYEFGSNAQGQQHVVHFHIDHLAKQSAPGKNRPVLILPSFSFDSRLCVAIALGENINHTSSFREEEKQLFISFVRPHHGVSKDTISRRIKKMCCKRPVLIQLCSNHTVPEQHLQAKLAAATFL